ncbi:sulfonate ABC transporter substrate-binding protein [Sphaerimonospora thailandensis]|uniref:Sulfonate ABC transporter substrate-binding protein n=2 Tax=Sphaerimonospora thailandensis TaxID=795644 RepID=A0A8J3REP4_9ACTN|nr:sulfonate ABC transporter substrate-binding protein [Sphaerimonospora thailandensis]
MGRTFAIGVAAVLALTACSNSETTSSSAGGTGLEKTTLVVGTIPVPDSAPLQVAIDRGFFKDEGLEVKPEVVAGGAVGVQKLLGGSIDLTLGAYIGTFLAQDKGAGKFKYVADSYGAAPGAFVIMVKKDSPIKTVADLKGKKIAVNTFQSVMQLTAEVQMKVAGVAATPDQFVEKPFPDMPAALENGQVDAAAMVEPFITVESKAGGRIITDEMTGPTEDLPVAGWFTTEDTANKYPKTMAAFQRALGKAQELVANDRKIVEETLPKYTKIDAATAAVISLGSYPTSLSETRLQRVIDLMKEYGYLKTDLDAKSMILPPPAS